MTEILSPNVELPKPPEAIGQAELEEVLRRARAPIIREGFAEPWTEDPATFDPVQAGWEQAARNVSARIQEMQSSGLVQLTPEGLTPKQAAAKAGESAKLAEANKRAAELAEGLRRQQAAGAAPRQSIEEPESSPRDQWNQFADDQRNADLGEWYKKLQAGESIEDWQRQALRDYNIWGSDSPPPAGEAEEPADEPDEEEVEEQVKSGLSKFLESIPWKRIVLEGATVVPPLIFGGTLGYFSPETARNISVAVGSAGVGLAFTSMAAAMAERILPVHIRAGLLGKALVAAKVGGLYGGNILLSTAIGTHIGAGIRAGIEALQAATQAAAGGGEGLSVDHPGPVDASTGQFGGLPPEDRGVGASIQPPADAGGAQPAPEVVPGAGVLPAEDLLAQPGDAEAIARQAAEAAEAARQAALDAATRLVEVQPNDTLTDLVARAGGDPYGADFTNTVLQSADVLTGSQNPHRDMARALIEFIKAHPGGVNWRDAINGVGDLAKETVGGMPLKDAIAQATRMIYPGQEMKVVVGAMP